jgi:transposase
VRTCEGRHASGPRRRCTARVPELVAHSARTPPRRSAALQALGVALGGQAGVRLAHRLGLSASRDTLLRRVRRLPLPVTPPLQAIGVDDGAPRKRQRDGTLVVDRARHQPVALLHDREADRLATGVHAHPGRTHSARDRLKA